MNIELGVIGDKLDLVTDEVHMASSRRWSYCLTVTGTQMSYPGAAEN